MASEVQPPASAGPSIDELLSGLTAYLDESKTNTADAYDFKPSPSLDSLVNLACRSIGKMVQENWFKSIPDTKTILNAFLMMSAAGGDNDLTQLLISKGANDWNQAMHTACFNGDESTVRQMILNGADNLNRGLEIAYAGRKSGRNIRMIALMLTAGATNAGTVFDGQTDADLIMQLLTETDVRRSSLKAVVGIDTVYARLDAIGTVSADNLSDLPTVLLRLVSSYLSNS